VTPPWSTRALRDRTVRWTALAVSGLLLAALPALPAQASGDLGGRTADGHFVFDGRGFGHGRGMSQYGAYGAGLRGVLHEEILKFYYSGVQIGSAATAQRRVLLTAEDGDAIVSNTSGLVLRDAASGRQVAAGDRPEWSRVRVRPEGDRLRVEAEQGGVWGTILEPAVGPVDITAPSPLSLHTPSGVRAYRGMLSAALSGQASKPLYVISTVGIDDYVRGVVAAEMPAGWHSEALRAQAVAARSYGLQPCPQGGAYPNTRLYDVVDTISCQVYGGASAETARTNDAVAGTAGKVVMYGGKVLRAEFSASNGGWTVAAGGAFQAKEDPYDQIGAAQAGSTVHRWTGVRVPASTLEARFGTGRLREIRVLLRDRPGSEWGGRVLTAALVGDARTVEVTGDQLRSAGGLRSSWLALASPIELKHAALGGDGGLLGPATSPEIDLARGRYRVFRSGAIYWTPSTGAQEVHGLIRDRWSGLGAENGPLGYPVTDELGTPDRIGRYNHFEAGSIYWTERTGAWSVKGAIRDTWSRLGWERSALGYPLTHETVTPDRVGRFNHFQVGSIYWTPTTGAREVRGSIRDTWSRLGWERSALGYPLTDEIGTPDRLGRFNHFQVGSIYWTLATGAHEVRGAIRDEWQRRGWETGALGYPTTDEYAVPGGRRNDFQGGSLVWSSSTGSVTLLPR